MVEVQALVLAAGQGERFGGNKLLTHYRGRPLLANVLDIVSAACKSGLVHGGHVIVAAEDQTSQDLCTKAGLEPIRNDAPGLGLSHSLQLGLGALEKVNQHQAAAAIIFLGDQPRVRLEIAEQLIAAYRRHRAPAIRPRYQERPDVPGHPILLDRSIWRLAHGLEGDRGIGTLLASTSTETTMIDVPGDNPDVDTRTDLLTLEELAP